MPIARSHDLPPTTRISAGQSTQAGPAAPARRFRALPNEYVTNGRSVVAGNATPLPPVGRQIDSGTPALAQRPTVLALADRLLGGSSLARAGEGLKTDDILSALARTCADHAGSLPGIGASEAEALREIFAAHAATGRSRLVQAPSAGGATLAVVSDAKTLIARPSSTGGGFELSETLNAQRPPDWWQAVLAAPADQQAQMLQQLHDTAPKTVPIAAPRDSAEVGLLGARMLLAAQKAPSEGMRNAWNTAEDELDAIRLRTVCDLVQEILTQTPIRPDPGTVQRFADEVRTLAGGFTAGRDVAEDAEDGQAAGLLSGPLAAASRALPWHRGDCRGAAVENELLRGLQARPGGVFILRRSNGRPTLSIGYYKNDQPQITHIPCPGEDFRLDTPGAARRARRYAERRLQYPSGMRLQPIGRPRSARGAPGSV